MAKYVYPAIFHPNQDDGSFTVTVPSLPGCITEGKNLADAIDTVSYTHLTLPTILLV